MRCVHFIGFRDDRYWNAVRVFGRPHFIHRWWAWVVVAMLVILARKVRKLDRRASIAIHVTFGTQILLGIATVMSQVDIPLAALHQLVGALLVVATAWGVHSLGRRA